MNVIAKPFGVAGESVDRDIVNHNIMQCEIVISPAVDAAVLGRAVEGL
jgi:hypothetical protein